MVASSSSGRRDRHAISRVVHRQDRLEALHRYRILDTAPESSFDRITRLAAHLFDVPSALVNFIDTDRQWFKSTVGFEEEQTGLDVSFCVYALADDDVMVVEDLADDERFADNPYVTDEGLRFYAGAPLVTPDGHRLGTLCVLDTEPRSPSDALVNRLSDLAALVVDELELRREVDAHERAEADLQESRALLRRAQELAHVGGWTYDPAADELTWTEETYRIHDCPVSTEIGVERAFDFYTPDSQSTLRSHVNRLLDEGGRYDLELDLVTAEGKRRRVRTIGTAHQADGETTRLTGAIQDVTERHRTERLQEMQSTFFEFIATGAEIDDVLTELCSFAEDHLYHDAAVSILRREEGQLHHAAAPSLPAHYTDAVDGMTIGPSEGTCGTAAHENREVITEDIRTDDRWEDHREGVEKAGVRSCWSAPIRGVEDEVLGTFAIYGAEPGPPSDEERELLRQMAHVAGVALMREKQEQALRRSEKRFRTVVENAQPVVFMVDRDGTFLLSEGKDLDVLGLEPGEVVGESVFERYADSPKVTDALRRALNGEQVDAELRVQGRVFENWYSPFYDDSGEVAGCIGMAADVTERKQMKESLREREERLKVAQRIANLGYWTYDLQTDELVWSEETRRIFGWPDAVEVTYESFMESVHPDDRERLRAAQEAARAGEERLDIEYRIRRPSGEERVVQERGGLRRNEDGEPVSMLGAVLDVTQRVRRREQLQEAKEAAEEADRIKTALLSNMNHELRTPLTSIISFSELIGDNPEMADRFVDRIHGGGKRLLYTLNTVMDFAELEGRTDASTPHSFSLRNVIRSVANDFRKRARRKEIELTVDVEGSLGSVCLHEHRVERILTHLVHNAVKFTDEGRVAVCAETTSAVVTLQVCDTGTGIDPAFLPKVFDEFAQASSGFDRTHEGNGLGLTVVQRFVEEMEGDIDIESEPGEGTCVTVSLPRRFESTS